MLSSRYVTKWAVALPAILAMASLCSAAVSTRYVATTGTDTGACTTQASPCKTINYAVGQSVAATPTGDTINVAAGTYGEFVTVDKAGLTILGAQSNVDARTRTGASETILDGTANTTTSGLTGFYLTASNTTINGFTIQNDTTQGPSGFAILLSQGVTGNKILNNIIQNNIVGIGLSGTSITIQYNLIKTNNQPGSASGDGIYTDEYVGGTGNVESNILIDNNTFSGNNSSGVDVSTFTAANAVQSFTISNNTFTSNLRGLILYNFQNSSITNNTFTSTTRYAVGIFGNGKSISITGNTMTTQMYGIRVGNFFDANYPNQTISAHTNNISGSTTAGLFISQTNDPANGEYQPAYSGTLDATCNYWGSSTGPMSPDNPSGTGDAISAAPGQVTDIPFLVAAGPSGSCSGGPPFITAQTFGPVRNNFTGYVGMKFTVGSSPLAVTSLGRIFVAGNAGTHTLKLVTASNGVDVPGGTTSINLSTAPAQGAYKYASLASAVTLQANTAYFLLSQESAGGDQWYDYGPVTSSGAGTVNGPEYQDGNGVYNLLSIPGQAYVPVNFIYTSQSSGLSATITSPASGATISGNNVPVTVNTTGAVNSIQLQVDGSNVGNPMTVQPNQQPPYTLSLDTTTLSNGSHNLTAVVTSAQNGSATSAPVQVNVNNAQGGASNNFITAQAPGAVRNNFSGFAGFKFTVGSAPLTVNSLGRFCLSGNSATHTVKLVQASNSANVPGGSVSLSLAGCTPNTYAFALLASPVSLQANTSYYVLSLEQSGGDTFYDVGPVTSASVGVVNGAAYQDGNGTYNTLSSPNQAYVPVNFTYGAANSNISVTITSPTSGSTVSGNNVQVQVSVSGPVQSVQLQIDGNNVGNPSTVPPYNLSFDSTALSNGSHTLVAVASGQGQPASSSPVNVTVSNGSSGNSTTFVTSQSLGPIRNNFTGYVGMAFTVGQTPITVTSLGRYVASGNAGTHTLKLVVANTGADVPGASVSISLSGATPNQYKFGLLASPVVLQANTTYYVLSLETAGGDQWFDYGPVTSTSVATVNGPAYQDGNGVYNVVNAFPNREYVPLNFMYQ